MHTSTKIALVTGAAKRLGRSIALRLAQDGWDIGVHYGQSAAEAQETVLAVQGLGRRAVALQADFAQQTQVDSLVSQCTTALRCLPLTMQKILAPRNLKLTCRSTRSHRLH